VVVAVKHPADCRVRKDNTMVTPKVNETKRGSAHKAAGAGTPASTPPAQR
jgi:hypothetical protein